MIGVIVFTGLTAWDAQRLKEMAATVPGERIGTYAVVGALSLYLNFINLFLMLLRLLGGRSGRVFGPGRTTLCLSDLIVFVPQYSVFRP